MSSNADRRDSEVVRHGEDDSRSWTIRDEWTAQQYEGSRSMNAKCNMSMVGKRVRVE